MKMPLDDSPIDLLHARIGELERQVEKLKRDRLFSLVCSALAGDRSRPNDDTKIGLASWRKQAAERALELATATLALLDNREAE